MRLTKKDIPYLVVGVCMVAGFIASGVSMREGNDSIQQGTEVVSTTSTPEVKVNSTTEIQSTPKSTLTKEVSPYGNDVLYGSKDFTDMEKHKQYFSLLQDRYGENLEDIKFTKFKKYKAEQINRMDSYSFTVTDRELHNTMFDMGKCVYIDKTPDNKTFLSYAKDYAVYIVTRYESEDDVDLDEGFSYYLSIVWDNADMQDFEGYKVITYTEDDVREE